MPRSDGGLMPSTVRDLQYQASLPARGETAGEGHVRAMHFVAVPCYSTAKSVPNVHLRCFP
jgi:hypothetical protein